MFSYTLQAPAQKLFAGLQEAEEILHALLTDERSNT
jgi:hypothetical protein